jgi:NAD(P)-dependent dehydrogenase (short-subunit alcohol dehydrogenase family)
VAYSPFDLSGKTVLVTGANRGIGLGMAEAVARAGADVVIWGSTASRNAEAEAKLAALGGAVLAQTVDVSKEDEVVSAMAEAMGWKGRLDAVFANAGIGRGSPSFVEMKTSVYREVLAVNLDGVFFTFREACRHMVERAKTTGEKGGSIVGVASLAAIEGAARNEAYAATKGAVISMMKSVAVEHARWGIRANAILPGWIATEMTAGSQASTTFAEKVMTRVPARRWGEPTDFGGIAVYLASDASAYHSGDTFVIDGGYSIF